MKYAKKYLKKIGYYNSMLKITKYYYLQKIHPSLNLMNKQSLFVYQQLIKYFSIINIFIKKKKFNKKITL